MGFGDRHHQVDLVGFERKRPLDPLEVRRQEPVGNVRKPVDLRHHLIGVGQLRNRLGMDDGGDLDILQTGPDQGVDDFNLLFGRDELLLVLEAVPRPHIDDGHFFRKIHGKYPFLIILRYRMFHVRDKHPRSDRTAAGSQRTDDPFFLQRFDPVPVQSQREKQLLAALPGGGRIVAKPEVVVAHPHGNPRELRLPSVRKRRFQQSPRCLQMGILEEILGPGDGGEGDARLFRLFHDLGLGQFRQTAAELRHEPLALVHTAVVGGEPAVRQEIVIAETLAEPLPMRIAGDAHEHLLSSDVSKRS